MNIIQASLKYKHVTLSVLLLLFAVGVNSLLNMPRREDPKITIRQGLVVAFFPGANSAQVEDQVTKKLEQYLFQYEEVNKAKTYSTTKDGEVVVNVELTEKVKQPDVFWSKLRHQLLISRQLDLPESVKGPIVNSDFGDTEALVIALECNEASYAQLKEYTQKLEDNLRTIPAASKIKRVGEQTEEIVVSSSSEKLSQYGVRMDQVAQLLQSQNSINATGNIKTDNSKAPLYTNGYYATEKELANQVVGTSLTGSVVKLGDVANLKRKYAEPNNSITVNGNKAMMLTVQMHEGNNIVKFGEEAQLKIEEIKKQLPSNVKITTIVNQPQVVDENISHFIKEFFLAIISVIIVVILLLPLRIAAVAAMAIPMTVAVTFAIMNAMGIELHQVSLAALIIVLGMVVDDAIVIADNYVELLDEGVDRWTAAWRSANDLVVPVLAATVTIIASFMPMVLLNGTIGEFIFALPITVAIALASSFLVAMVLTPMLCYTFIKKGLHEKPLEAENNNQEKKKKLSLLDYMQNGYNSLLDWCVLHPKTTILCSLLPIALAALLFSNGIKQKFFPAAERSQFVVELWMPTGTKLEKTNEAILKAEALLKGDKRIVTYATFTGTAAPRFYYNFSPEFPATNYAQIVINTTTEQTTDELSEELSKKLPSLIPEGTPFVKLMQQGAPLKSPIEVRIIGEDINTIKQIAAKTATIIKNEKGSLMVRNDYAEDYYGIGIKLNNEANRLGFTTTSISQSVYTGFSGAAISSIYEGNNQVNIVFRLDENSRRGTNDLNNIYLKSPITGADVPLRQIADLTPQWQPGRIMHRNGVKTLTVQTETVAGVLPSELLKVIKPKIDALQLPVGYRIEYGGEFGNQEETSGQLITVLMVSIVLIFFILLFQFKNLKETAIVMLTIPLSLFGAIFGLFVTGNNFSFTAFVGLIALSGIVVRNAIILVDHTNELMKHGMSIKEAAIESGKRRLRPIFLTAMAAAIGVLPMIISASPMWAPLASVLAFGVVWSMLMALLTVPILYIGWIKESEKKDLLKSEEIIGSDFKPNHLNTSATLLILLFCTSSLFAQQKPKYNLQQITDSAVVNNPILKIKALQVLEKNAKIKEDIVKRYPSATLNSTYQYNANLGELTIPAGSFGSLPLNPTTTITLPGNDKSFTLGEHNNYNAGVTIYQPISQQAIINTGIALDKADVQITEKEKSKINLQITQAVEKLYYGILIAKKQTNEANAKLELAKLKLYDVESALLSGKTIDVNKAGLQANIADEEQNLLKLNIQIQDYWEDLKKLSGIKNDAIALEDVTVSTTNTISVDQYKENAANSNIDLQIASLNKSKALLGIKAAKQSYLPDLGIIAGYTYQKGNILFATNNPFVGANLKWNMQELFSNKQVVVQRKYQLQQAEENCKNTKDQVNADIEKAYRLISQAEALIAVAKKALYYRKEALKIQTDKQAAGLNLKSDILETQSLLAKAEADLYATQLAYQLALSDLKFLTGK
jgi:multidrug efflux pump subunit AcrB/outer membrane protein TolC